VNTPRNNSVLYLCKQRLDTPAVRLLLGVTLALGVALALVWGLAGACVPAVRAVPMGSVIYVDRDATGAGTGLSWTDAYARLQDGLDAAGPGDEIWVAEGVYTPTAGVTRTATFQLKSGVALYGGFAATEVTRTQRNWETHVTVLSGDLDGNDGTDVHSVVTATENITGANAYHVVVGSGVTGTAVLDGFYITAGHADAVLYPDYDGGGMFNYGGSPTLANVIFSGNAANEGGGMANTYSSSPILMNVIFSSNSAQGRGGGIYNWYGSNPTLTNVTFSGNSADHYGGGMYNHRYSSPMLTGVTFSGNSAGNLGGGMYNEENNPVLMDVTFSDNIADQGGGMYNFVRSSPILTNAIFSDNFAKWDGGGMYNSDSNPVLTNVIFNGNSAGWSGGGMHNTFCSPTLRGVIFSFNSADDFGGGGMANLWSNPTLIDVTFSGDSANTCGGGMANDISSPTLVNVTFSGNSAGDDGGGMHNWDSSPTLVNVTFSNNSAECGGGMYNWDSSPTLTHVTFSGNSAISGVGIYSTQNSSPTVRNTLFVRSSTGNNCTGDAFAAGSGHNLADDGSCGASTAQSAYINLGPLGDYGGDTQTVPLLPGSAAIDASDPAYCPATDQRGAGRVGTCDIGAFEAQGFTLAALGGSGQSTPITRMFPQPLQVGATSVVSPADPVDGGTVTFAAPVSGASIAPPVYTATIGGGAAALTATANCVVGGPYTVTAGTAGAAKGVDFALTNTQGLVSTTTTLDSAPNPSPYGQGVIFTATATSICGAPIGDVTFYDHGVLLDTVMLGGSGIATTTAAALAPGTHPITVTYGGDASFDPSTSDMLNQVVDNTPPVAAVDNYTSTGDVPLIVAAPGVLGNDTDTEGNPLTAILDADVLTGTLDLDADGSFVYTPPPDYAGVVTFTYHASDGYADSNVVQVTIAVQDFRVYLPLVIRE
jgi:hypothetical protein